MRCKSCDYPLWNLRSRICPECGSGFAPSDFDFVVNSVRYCCPGCGQDYYGTGEKGHLVPATFACVRCGQGVSMDEMVLLPTEGVTEEQTETEVVPWLDRARRGFFRGWLGTIGMVLARPARLGRAMPPGRGGAAWWFAILTVTLYGLAAGSILLIPMLFSPAGFAVFGLQTIVGPLIALPIGVAVCIVVWSALAHAILRLGGPTAQGFGRTVTCLCYSSAASMLIAIPCVGFYLIPVAWAWPAVAGAVMLTTAQRVSGVRAAAAAVIPPLAVLLMTIGAVVFYAVPAFQRTIATATAAAAGAQSQLPTWTMTTALVNYAAQHRGNAPPHALALLEAGAVSLPDFFSGNYPVSAADRTVAGTDAARFPAMSPPEQIAAVSAAAATLPRGVVAHRFGDMVFVYHGIDFSPGSAAHPDLWLVVCAPAPATTSGPVTAYTSTPMVFAGTVAGTVVPIPMSQLQSSLAAQNALRAAAGLASLPDPTTVPPPPTAAPLPAVTPGEGG